MLSGFTGWHLIILSIVFFIPFVLAAVSIARSRTAIGTEKAVWVLLIVLFPLIGPVLWFVIGRRSQPGNSARSS